MMSPPYDQRHTSFRPVPMSQHSAMTLALVTACQRHIVQEKIKSSLHDIDAYKDVIVVACAVPWVLYLKCCRTFLDAITPAPSYMDPGCSAAAPQPLHIGLTMFSQDLTCWSRYLDVLTPEPLYADPEPVAPGLQHPHSFLDLNM